MATKQRVYITPSGYVYHRERACSKILHPETLKGKMLAKESIIPERFIQMPGKPSGGEFFTRRRRLCQFC